MLYAKVLFISAVEETYTGKDGKERTTVKVNLEFPNGDVKKLTVRDNAVAGLKRFEEVIGYFEYFDAYGKLYFVGYEREVA